MSIWKENLLIASSTVIVGTLAYVGIPHAAPWSTLIGSAAAATGSHTIWAKKRQISILQQIQKPPKPPVHSLSIEEKGSFEKGSFEKTSLSDETNFVEQPRELEVFSEMRSQSLTEVIEHEIQSPETKESVDLQSEISNPPTSEPLKPETRLPTPDNEKIEDTDPINLESESIQDPETETPKQTTHLVVAKLQSLEIEVKDYGEPRASDVLFDQSALMLGDRYHELEDCFNVFSGKYRHFDSLTRQYFQGKLPNEPKNVLFYRFKSDSTPEYRSLCHDFFSLLKRNTLIQNVKWSHKDNDLLIVVFQKNLDPSVLNFINGFWLERYVYQKIKQVLVKNEQRFSYLRNVTIKSSETGKYNELDILFLVEDELFWCECTTGRQYSKNLEKYSHHLQKLLDLPAERTFLVLRSSVINEEIALGISDKWGITVANEANLETKLQSSLG